MPFALAFLRSIPLRWWGVIGAVAAVLTLYGAFKYQQHRADRAEADLAPAIATGKALDSVATQTPIIRQDQKERQDAVDQIQGSDDRLPDGYGAELERLRNGRANPNPR